MANPNPSPATRFQPGQITNPGGKPLAARHALNAKFLKALSADFDEYGISAIQRAREEDPIGYVRVLAALQPKEVEVKQSLDELSDEQLNACIIACRSILAAQDAGVGADEAAVAEQA